MPNEKTIQLYFAGERVTSYLAYIELFDLNIVNWQKEFTNNKKLEEIRDGLTFWLKCIKESLLFKKNNEPSHRIYLIAIKNQDPEGIEPSEEIIREIINEFRNSAR